MDEVRIEVRVKNNRLWEAIVPVFGSVAEFCRRAGMNQVQVGALISLKASPFRSGLNNMRQHDNMYRPLAVRLAEICGWSCDELFPLELYARVTAPFVVKTMSLNAAIAAVEGRDLANAVEMDDFAFDAVRAGAVGRALSTISSANNRAVVRMRFGLGGRPPMTLEEVAGRFRVGRTRAGQMEAKAIRQLRHRSRSSWLEKYVGDNAVLARETV